MLIQTLEAAAAQNGWKFFLFGFAGVGKTPSLLTIPGHGLIVNAEAGLRSMLGRQAAGTFDVVCVKSIKDLKEVHTHLASGQHQYTWVALDSVSEIAEVIINEEKARSPDPRKAYGKLIEKMDPLLKDFRDLALDVYMIGKAANVKEEETGRITIEIAIPGSKVGPSIPYLFDEVFYMLETEDRETGDVNAWFQTKANSKVRCRDRSGRLAPFEPVDFGAILAKLNAK
jgi:hypothetical protein